MPFRVLDLFCGTGGFSKGFENQGAFDVVFGIDVFPIAVETFSANHPGALALAADIRRVPPERVGDQLALKAGDVDCIIGGPPCQGFSSIRPHRSSEAEDHRNSLFVDFAKYVSHFRPRTFVMENVVGLVTHREGDTLEQIEEAFWKLGYVSDWRVLNAAHFGVPQKRERLILVGVEKGATPLFPEPTHACDVPTIGIRNKARMLLPPEPTLFDEVTPLPPAITVDDAIDDLPQIGSGEMATIYDQPPRTPYQAARRKGAQELTLHYSTVHTPRMLEIIRHSGRNIAHIPADLITSGFSSCYSRIAGDEPCVTITVNFVHPASNRCIHPRLDRALTRREGARLQAYDDDFVFKGNSSQINKQIGNAVPPLLGTAIATPLARLLGASAESAA